MRSSEEDAAGAAVPASGEHAASDVKSCPSAPCVEGALLVGVKTESGRLAYVQPPTRIDAAFVARAREQGRPEARFRFSLPCSESGCPQWTGSGCGVVDHVLAEEGPQPPAALPHCAIRSTCRWFHQRGADACSVCPLVVADTGGTETYSSTIGASIAPRRSA